MAGLPFVQKWSRFFQYRKKAIEFRYQTWKNRREIRHAYAVSSPFHIRLDKRQAIIAAAFVGAIAIAFSLFALIINIRPSKRAVVQKVSAVEQTTDGTELLHGADTVAGINKASDSVKAVPVEAEQESVRTRDDLLWHIPEHTEYILVANKIEKKIYVLKRYGAAWRESSYFDIAIGANGGRKAEAGDKKTPEGQYFIVGRKDATELADIYGPMAYVLNYPNEHDLKAGRTGQGIWIHGTSPDSIPIDTRGCLELSNEDLLQLSRLIGNGIGTPILIMNKRYSFDAEKEPDFAAIAQQRAEVLKGYRRQQQQFGAVLHEWEQAWESKDMQRYASCYAVNEFRGQGMFWKAWQEKKQRTFDIYERIDVEVKKLIVCDFSPSEAIVKFIQGYASDVIRVENGKKLWLAKHGQQWKIHREETFPKEELLL